MWEDYESQFIQLMKQRKIEDTLDKAQLDRSCLLCSEDQPQFCHRRLVAEYLEERWGKKAVVLQHLI